jgi:hypothetical protein
LFFDNAVDALQHVSKVCGIFPYNLILYFDKPQPMAGDVTSLRVFSAIFKEFTTRNLFQ